MWRSQEIETCAILKALPTNLVQQKLRRKSDVRGDSDLSVVNMQCASDVRLSELCVNFRLASTVDGA